MSNKIKIGRLRNNALVKYKVKDKEVVGIIKSKLEYERPPYGYYKKC